MKDTELAFFNDRQSLTVDDSPRSPFYGRVYVGWDRLARRTGSAYTGDGLIANSADGGASFSIRSWRFRPGTTSRPSRICRSSSGRHGARRGDLLSESGVQEERRTLLRRSLDRWWSELGAGLIPEAQKPVECSAFARATAFPMRPSTDGTGPCTPSGRTRGSPRGSATTSCSSGRQKGRTWSAPIKVNDTPAGAQAAFLPTVKVDANGRVGVVYYDLRHDTNPRDGAVHHHRVDRARPTAADLRRELAARRTSTTPPPRSRAASSWATTRGSASAAPRSRRSSPRRLATQANGQSAGHLRHEGGLAAHTAQSGAPPRDHGEGLVPLALHERRVEGSRLRRRRGSVFEGRTFRCQSGAVMEMPSRWRPRPGRRNAP